MNMLKLNKVVANDPKHLRSWLNTLPHHRVAVMDGDAAGRKLAKYGHESLQMPAGEDVNSVSEADFHKFFSDWK
jgi:hypothetical protein